MRECIGEMIMMPYRLFKEIEISHREIYTNTEIEIE